MKCCITCAHFRDAHYSRVYVTPRCTVRGDDDAMYMRQYVCGVEEATLYEHNKMAENDKSTIEAA